MYTKLFEVYMFLINFAKGIGLNSESPVFVGIFIIGIAFILLKIFNEKFTLRELSSLGLITLIGLLNFLIAKDTAIFFTAISFWGMKNIDYDRIIKVSLYARLVGFGIMMLISIVNFKDIDYMLFWRNGEIIKRYSFGYGHPNTAHFTFALIVLLALYSYGEKLNIISAILILALNQILFQFTYSRTSYVLVILGVLIFALLNFEKPKKFLSIIFKNSYMGLFLLTIMVSLAYGKFEFVSKLNELLTGRIYFNHILLSVNNLSLFGKAEFSQDLLIDNGQLDILFKGGIFAFLWFSYFYQKSLNYLFNKNLYKPMALIFCVLIFSLTEAILSSINTNTSLIFMSLIVFNNNKYILEDISEGKALEISHIERQERKEE